MVTAVEQLTIQSVHASQRIDNFLRTRLKGLPKSRLYKALRKGEVRVNKKRVDPDYRLQAGDIIRIPPLRLAAPGEKAAIPQTLSTEIANAIIAKHPDFLIINKPAFLAVHRGSGVEVALIDILKSLFPKEAYLQLAHRLDRDTSGCILIARNPRFLRYFQEQLLNHRVEKQYHALVKGHWAHGACTIDAPLKRAALEKGERMVCVDSLENGAKKAITHFMPIQYSDAATLLGVTLVTGRTHQIRVHTAHCGHPVLGDQKYGDKSTNLLFKKHGLKRLALHAAQMAFYLPNGDRKVYTAKTPAIFTDLLKG